jgi:hypothetical protein
VTRVYAAPSKQQFSTRLATVHIYLVNVGLGGASRGFLGYVEVHAAHLLVHPGHHSRAGFGWGGQRNTATNRQAGHSPAPGPNEQGLTLFLYLRSAVTKIELAYLPIVRYGPIRLMFWIRDLFYIRPCLQLGGPAAARQLACSREIWTWTVICQAGKLIDGVYRPSLMV